MSTPSISSSGSSAVSSVNSKSSTAGLDGPGLGRLMEKKFKDTLSDGVYTLDSKDAKKLFDDPAIKGNMTGFVTALLSKGAPSIKLETDSLAEVFRRLGAEYPKNNQAAVAAWELTKELKLQFARATNAEMDRAWDAGEKGLPYTFKEPKETKPYGGRCAGPGCGGETPAQGAAEPA